MAGKRSVFIKQLSGYMTVVLVSKFLLLVDNTAADDLSKKLGVQPRTAHFLNREGLVFFDFWFTSIPFIHGGEKAVLGVAQQSKTYWKHFFTI